MNDLISRQAAIDGLYEMSSDIDHLCTLGDYVSFLESLSAQPEIIRCKDCAKREYCRTSTVWAIAPSDDWYCADAAPKGRTNETD